MKRILYIFLIASFIALEVTGQSLTINTVDKITNGSNFDVDVINGKVFLISNNYYELDHQGNVTYTNTDIDDTGQGTFDFGPAIEVGPDGSIHIIHRDGGDRRLGFNIKYSKRETSGNWSVENHMVGSPMGRNYVVDVIGMEDGSAVYAHSAQTTDNVYGSVYFYTLNGLTINPLGEFGNPNYYRTDSDFRMEKYNNHLHFAVGNPNPYGTVHYMNSEISSTLPTDLVSSVINLDGERDYQRRGQPDLKVNKKGDIYISYGDYESVFFDKYSFDGASDIHDQRILTNLGEWHLNLGLSAIGTSPGGDTLLLIGMETGGNHEIADNCKLLYRYSYDGGQTWASTEEIPDYRANSAEGRSRPRVHFDDNKFYVFSNNATGGIGMSVIELGDSPPPPPPPPPDVELVDPVDLTMAHLASGRNFDVEVSNDRIYIISDHYYEFNLEGEKYAENILIDDIGQSLYDFHPSLSVGIDGEVHVITRYDGDKSSGFSLAYSKKLSDGNWQLEEHTVGEIIGRNYVVDVAALDNGTALFAHGSNSNVEGFGSIHFYGLDGTSENSYGDLGRIDLYKTNSDFEIGRFQNTLHVATGKPFGEGSVYYMEGSIGPSLVANLTGEITTLEAGSGLSGQPDLFIDNTGDVMLTYGSEQTVFFHEFVNDGSPGVEAKPIFADLGTWKLDLGLSALGATPDGETLFAVGIKTDNTISASNCSLYYTYSLDGGNQWIYPLEIPGITTSAGEGRMRPKIEFYEGRFYVFYYNNAGGIGIRTFDIRNATPTKAVSPRILPSKDSLSPNENIYIESPSSDAIFYSFSDDSPDMLSSAYTGPFTIESDTSIHAIAFRRGYLPSNIVSVSKIIKGDTVIPPPPPPPPPPPNLVDPIDLHIEALGSGRNFDVDIANDRIYLISDHYREYNLAGDLITTDTLIVDSAQSDLDFGPAIAIGSEGEVHIVTRRTGSMQDGYNLFYSKKEHESNWSVVNHRVGDQVARNYVVDVVALDQGKALYAHSAQTISSTNGTIYFYALDNENIEEYGKIENNDLFRANSDFRMERFQNQLHLASGKPDEDGTVFYMNSEINPTLPLTLSDLPIEFKGGRGQQGQPDLRISSVGDVFLSYGSDQSILFNRRSLAGTWNTEDELVFNELGTWHLNLGLSALETTPNGDTLFIVGLKTNDSKEASECEIYYSYSFDGGFNWVYPLKLNGSLTNGGEGRMRPRVRYYRGRFYIFHNNVNGKIGVRTIDLRNETLMKTPPPLLFPDKDFVTVNEQISMEAPDSDAIYYTLNDPDPGLHSRHYSAPFTIEDDEIIYARAYERGHLPSDVAWDAKFILFTDLKSTDTKAELIQVYPTPAQDILFIESSQSLPGHAKLMVYDPIGKMVYTSTMEESFQGGLIHQIDVTEWLQGTYVLKILSEEGSTSYQIIISR